MVQVAEGASESGRSQEEIRGKKMARALTAEELALLDTLVKLARDMEDKVPVKETQHRNPVLHHVRSETSITQWARWRIDRKARSSESEVDYGSSQLADAQADYYLPDGTPLRSRWDPRGGKKGGMYDISVDVGRPVRLGEEVEVVSRRPYDHPDRLLTTRDGKKRAVVFYGTGSSAQGMIVRVGKPLKIDSWTPGGAEFQGTDEYQQLTWLLAPKPGDGPHMVWFSGVTQE